MITPDAPRRWLILMMKAPRPGRVKTRLAADIGSERALTLYRKFVAYLTESLLSGRGDWQSLIAYDPPDAEDQVLAWLRPLAGIETIFIPQSAGDLGERLTEVFRYAFAEKANAVLALGTDCLDLDTEEIQRCFEQLENHDAVLGEANDGGYWCVGMSAPHFELFDSMPWSQPTLIEATRRRAREAGLTVAERPLRIDVDCVSDLEGISGEVWRRLGFDREFWASPSADSGSARGEDSSEPVEGAEGDRS